jgi:ribosomal protein S27E/DNA-directed RNA polymerase subunit RPC12/RpoP
VFGNVYRCTKCRFSFSSGWSHHEGGQLLVCTACSKHYVLGGGQSCWGAKNGECLQLLTGNKEGQVPTGVNVVVNVSKPDSAKKWDGVFLLQFEDIPCPGCGGRNVIVQSLEEESPCPACGRGVVKKDGTCIY